MASAAEARHLQPRSVGRYALFDEIAAGGMATVHYGRLVGPVGFSRTVAIKRLHPQFAKDQEFVEMFLDEAKLASRIQHPNVVTTLDVVSMEDELFLVMEYVAGESLAKLLKVTSERGERVPVNLMLPILTGLLHGLHAAHEATSEQRQPLNIVHRDISPQNVLVGVDGVARVLDFGVAKAAMRKQSTRDSQMKGKLSYMSPEQLNAKHVDRRSDVFSAGIVCWEALTGQRLFAGSDAGEILGKVLTLDVVPPHEVPCVGRAVAAESEDQSGEQPFDQARGRGVVEEPKGEELDAGERDAASDEIEAAKGEVEPGLGASPASTQSEEVQPSSGSAAMGDRAEAVEVTPGAASEAHGEAPSQPDAPCEDAAPSPPGALASPPGALDAPVPPVDDAAKEQHADAPGIASTNAEESEELPVVTEVAAVAQAAEPVVVTPQRDPNEPQPIDKRISDVVMRALQRDPDARWPTARDFAIALEDAAAMATAHRVGTWVEKTAGEALHARIMRVAEIESYPTELVGAESKKPSAPEAQPPSAAVSVEAVADFGPRPPSRRRTYAVLLALGLTGVAAAGVLTNASGPASDDEDADIPTTTVVVPQARSGVDAPRVVTPSDAAPPAQPSASGLELAPAPPSAVPSAATPSVSVTTPAQRVRPAPPVARRPWRRPSRCDPPWYVDQEGIKRIKKGCLPQ